ncbi:MAG: MBOAT family protein [Muribaculaceae bacterium]|nr:MBOAT family protein [Muribaculaceae bacterium]
MLFNSYQYLIFLPLVWLLYWHVFKPLRWQNLFLLVASYVFYGWWDWRFLALIAITSACSYASGLAIRRLQDAGRRRAAWWVSAANIVFNLGILATFKYYNFFVESAEELLAVFGLHMDWPTANLILPVGISFYTFQALSYSIDVYKGKIAPTRDMVAFFAFICFFPQLVAGPIERATNLLPQILKARRFDHATAVDGLRQVLWGLVKKMVVADSCAMAVNRVWAAPDNFSSLTLLLGAVLFSFQIYCDFSGYSDIAIGSAKLFGIKLMRNFSVPYFSRNMSEFWRRWHISLLTWFRDYVYIPLGGSRCAQWKIIRNVFVVYLLSGLWHGANWTFILWGVFHAVLILAYRFLGFNAKHKEIVAHNSSLPNLKEAFSMVVTFILATIGWVLFRAETIADAWHYFTSLFTRSMFDLGSVDVGKKALVLCLVLLVVDWIGRKREHPLQFDGNGLMRHRACRWALYYSLIAAIIFLQGHQEAFIYFQF